jgi:hypothetical protein
LKDLKIASIFGECPGECEPENGEAANHAHSIDVPGPAKVSGFLSEFLSARCKKPQSDPTTLINSGLD